MAYKQCSSSLMRHCMDSLRLPIATTSKVGLRQSHRFSSIRSLSQLSTRSHPPRSMTLPFTPFHSSRPLTTSAILRIVQSSPKSIRQTYFPKSGGQGNGPSSQGPWRGFIRWLNRLPHMTVIYGIIGVNVGVFMLWQYGIQSYQRFRDPSIYKWMSENFVLNENNVMAGRIHTLLTACFSHSTGSHILLNCLGLYFVAPAAASLIGTASFLGLYLGGGVLASLTSLAWHRAVGDKRWKGSEGASGAIYASLAFYGALFPQSTFLLFFVVPMPAWAMIGGIFAYDLYSAVFQPMSGTDSAGHMGGIAAGVGAAMWLKRRGRGPRPW